MRTRIEIGPSQPGPDNMATGTRRIIAYAVAAITSLLGVGSLLLFGLFLWTGSFGLVDMRMAEHAILS